MSLMWLVGRHVDRQKRELMQYLANNGACDAEHAIILSGVGVKPSILRSLVSRGVVKQAAYGRYFLDPSRVQQAWGASNRFILYAIGATLVGTLIIMLW